MIQLPVFTKKVCSEACDFVITYYLLSTGRDEGPVAGYYGIGISKQDKYGQDELENVAMVSQDAREVFDIISLLYEGTVTPLTLKDVLRDYIKDKEMSIKHERPSA